MLERFESRENEMLSGKIETAKSHFSSTNILYVASNLFWLVCFPFFLVSRAFLLTIATFYRSTNNLSEIGFLR